jgi:hypothetical protein
MQCDFLHVVASDVTRFGQWKCLLTPTAHLVIMTSCNFSAPGYTLTDVNVMQCFLCILCTKCIKAIMCNDSEEKSLSQHVPTPSLTGRVTH